MQRVVNYGSFLQAYGLKHVLESLGHKVEFVDYRVEKPVATEELNSNNSRFCVKKILNLFSYKYHKYRNKQIKMNTTFSQFVNSYTNEFLSILDVNNNSNYDYHVDLLLIGSDEVFNCTQSNTNVGYSKELFGYNNHSEQIASYAASFGSTTLDKLKLFGIYDEISKLLNRFDYLSVRDNNSVEILKSFTDKEIHKNIDPVLLYEFDEVNDINIALDDYLIVYAYAGRINEYEEKEIIKFAKERKLKILTVGFYQPYSDLYILANPLEVLAYFKKAKYVITDTFHGTVFSIKYQIPFGTIIRSSNNQKISDLLNTFDLNDRKIDDITNLGMVLDNSLDKEAIKCKIKREQELSLMYLKSILK